MPQQLGQSQSPHQSTMQIESVPPQIGCLTKMWTLILNLGRTLESLMRLLWLGGLKPSDWL
ncbi:hypothetical protein EUX98_g244 [Antrodiella citrinella]|uniref:Uncharacterized protein n=1 Tax=Antrodiella citrinella TaxID=2447956 RepID=A0A4S4N4H0_9APHY|nr:hypothetical protein EUX98_g244 [Antrodiella citrinella]